MKEKPKKKDKKRKEKKRNTCRERCKSNGARGIGGVVPGVSSSKTRTWRRARMFFRHFERTARARWKSPLVVDHLSPLLAVCMYVCV